jgi:vacuolar-type H+-ATPase subunit H
MPVVQDRLRRFRLSAVPGAPATAGVPIDRTLRLEGELRPLLAQLGEAEQRTAAVEEQFDLTIGQLFEQARTHAAQTVSEAHSLAASERDNAIAIRTAAAQREREETLTAARAEAERIGRKSTQQLPDLVREAVALVLGAGDTPQ